MNVEDAEYQKRLNQVINLIYDFAAELAHKWDYGTCYNRDSEEIMEEIKTKLGVIE